MSIASAETPNEADDYVAEIVPKVARALDITEGAAQNLLRRYLVDGEHIGTLSYELQIPATDLATALVGHSLPLKAAKRGRK